MTQDNFQDIIAPTEIMTHREYVWGPETEFPAGFAGHLKEAASRGPSPFDAFSIMAAYMAQSTLLTDIATKPCKRCGYVAEELSTEALLVDEDRWEGENVLEQRFVTLQCGACCPRCQVFRAHTMIKLTIS